MALFEVVTKMGNDESCLQKKMKHLVFDINQKVKHRMVLAS